MKLIYINNIIRVYSQYEVNTVAQLKSIPGSRFGKDLTGAYWDIPTSKLPLLLDMFNLSPGFLYPNCTRFINPKHFSGARVEIKHDRIKISGSKSSQLAKSIYDLCSYEYKYKDQIIETFA